MDADCGGNGFICGGSGFSNVDGELCALGCTKEADCAGDTRACVLRSDRTDDVKNLVCAAVFGAAVAGESVAASGECQTGFTLIQDTERYCTAFCVVDGDCPAAVPNCTDVEVSVPSGVTTQTQFVCAR